RPGRCRAPRWSLPCPRQRIARRWSPTSPPPDSVRPAQQQGERVMKQLAWLSIALLAGCAPQAVVDGNPPAALARASHPFPAVQAVVDAAVRDGRVPAIWVAIGVGDAPTTFVSAGTLAVDSD